MWHNYNKKKKIYICLELPFYRKVFKWDWSSKKEMTEPKCPASWTIHIKTESKEIDVYTISKDSSFHPWLRRLARFSITRKTVECHVSIDFSDFLFFATDFWVQKPHIVWIVHKTVVFSLNYEKGYWCLSWSAAHFNPGRTPTLGWIKALFILKKISVMAENCYSFSTTREARMT